MTKPIFSRLLQEIYETKSFDMSKLQQLPPETLERTLVEWRDEQLQKVEEELHLLLVIEDMMRSSEVENFDGYTDEKKFGQIIKQVRNTN
mgnify:CR=1 FL=1